MNEMTNDEARTTNDCRGKACLAPTTTSRLFLRRRAQAAFSLIEILIAMFVFLVGVLGVLSIFPVAMQSAGRSTGEVRSTILAQNVIAQMNADSQAAYERGACADNGGNSTQLRRAVGGADRSGRFVTLTSGPGQWQSRLIYQDNGTTMQVVPDWKAVGTWTGPGDPDSPGTDAFVVTRMGLPLSPAALGVRSGYIRDINGDTIYAGKLVDPANPVVDALTIGNCAPPALALGSTVSDAGGSDYIKGFGVTWGVDAFRGKLLVITEDTDTKGPAVGQVRWITSNSSDTLQIYPSLAQQPDWANNVRFEIHDGLGYFLVITSGRASGRIFPITGFAADGAGDKITCAGVNFTALNVKGAKRGSTYPLSGADSFAVIGGPSTLLTAFPVVSGNPSYVFNSFGRRNTADRQAGPDVYARVGVKEASDFDLVAILSAEEASAEAPVRADVFVFRNYDSAKTPQGNQRAMGYMTGYIGRPKP